MDLDCDLCNEPLVYEAETVELTMTGGQFTARVVPEDQRQTLGHRQVSGTFHLACYEAACEQDHRLPALGSRAEL